MNGEERETGVPRTGARQDDEPAGTNGCDRDDRPEQDAAGRSRRRKRRRRRLPFTTRIWFWLAGGLLFALGIAGLFLPFLQGILLLLLAAALLSLASDTIYTWLESTTAERWPHLWRRMERFRTRVHWTVRPRVKKPEEDPSQEDSPPEGEDGD